MSLDISFHRTGQPTDGGACSAGGADTGFTTTATTAARPYPNYSSIKIINHPNWTFIKGDQNLNLTFNSQGQLTAPQFGTATNKTGHRIMEAAVKFIF